MDANPVQTLYTQKARFYQFFFVDFLRWGEVLGTFFQQNAYLHPEMKILDAGCGTGIVTKMLHRLVQQKGFDGVTFHGFDLTPAMLDLFRQWMDEEGVKDIQLQQADVLDLGNQLPEDWTGYDLIISSTMMEYIPKEKRNQALQNLRSLLTRNGHLVIFVTKDSRITRWTAAKWWHINLLGREELEAELLQAGFTTIQTKTLPGFWDSFITALETV